MLFTAFFAGSSSDTLTEPGRPAGSYADLPVPVPAVSAGLPGDSEDEVVAGVLSGLFRYNPDKPFIFSAPAFWVFFLLVLAGYSLIYKKLSGRNLYLFVVSLFFYYKTGGLFLILLIIVTFIDYFCGLLIYRSESVRSRRFFLVLSILSNIGILAYFKYTGFFVDTLNNLLGTSIEVYDYLAAFSNTHLGSSFNVSNIILPVGISFFTFQSLSYTFDVYLRKLEPVRNMVDFGFYVSFFPQLVAGPIVRASEFIPQLYAEFHLARREFSHALFLISKGLIKKIIISDFIAVNFVDRVFELPAVYSGFENLMAVYGYGLQIYCDFSGYTDIAIGLGLILGFRIPVNFNSPYKAMGVSDFWKRWHISLSRWLRDYLYIPLGGNRKGKVRTGFNLMITMLLGGLWHGAALRFVIWGGLHGIGLIINKLWNFLFGSRIVRNKLTRALMVFLTFQFVSFCWIFFRAPDMEHAFIMLNQIAANFSPGSYMAVLPLYSTVFSLIIAGYLIHFLPEKVKESYRGLFIRIPLAVQLAAVLLMAVVIYQIRTADIMPFIYFRF
ncbi:MAG: MBOAT family protein [Bacteroidales bacterium]|nr:MBOAT family protein [Bacteroidales bacterium]